MNAFIAEKRTDLFLLYNERNLPNAIKGAELPAKFLKFQKLVLSPHHIDELEQEGCAHHHINSSADECFSYVKDLGVGKYGVVDYVYATLGLGQYVRKRILRGASTLRDQEALNQFENELTALKTLTHMHLVKLVSSYKDPSYVGLIMTPIADEDLQTYLGRLGYLERKLTSDTERNLRKQRLSIFFGCLANALIDLHSNKIRHKDIKARGIFLKGTNVLFTDFRYRTHMGRRWLEHFEWSCIHSY
ncbi:hypothetical protein H2201_004539 [Coniosporium apollinis]|uniref:Protein kinase domain-containing protein n=2 Tax=Coniosporium TaxID=2810619 RepID=A0ABQ9NSX3_9PEZI|nr:hypothetical protein H2199_005219 [Cladosporium sp. JES 115]KAJ9665461.1 hypothetical protein H2201_004539 [Coniosporium apollinis]